MQSDVPIEAAAGDWLAASLPWIALAGLLALAATAVGVWLLVRRAREDHGRADTLAALESIREALARLAAERADIDLRRIEHVLVDIRDAQRRLEDSLLRALEAARTNEPASPSAPGADHLAERATNRLLSLGYERVQIVTAAAELARLSESDGEVLVEARRQGVLHKGRVLVRGGRIHSVELNPPFAVFP